jgi:hypothetical protein
VDFTCSEEDNPEVEEQEPQPSTSSASAVNAEKVVENIRRAQARQKKNNIMT